MRLFVAIETPAPLRVALEGVCERGRRGGVLWVPAENAHLTLKFLGEVEEDLAPKIEAALAPVAAAVATYDLALGGGGCFPHERAPRVIWIGLAAGTAETVRLAAAVEEALTPLGFAPEKRPLRAHLTIGRVKDPAAGGGAARAKIKTLQDFRTDSAPAADLVLYQSTLTPQGSRYRAVARFPLAGR